MFAVFEYRLLVCKAFNIEGLITKQKIKMPPNKNESTNPKKNKGKKQKLANQVQKLTETIQSMNNQSNRPLWGKEMNANKFKAIDTAASLQDFVQIYLSS